jgi:hypothetical protein
MTWLLGAGEKETDGHRYDFNMTDREGQVLGKGTIALPFAFGSEGKGTASWQFTASVVSSTNKYWLKAKARLAKGTGDAKAACEDSWFTLDFNPGWADNNVTVSWALKKKESGTVHFDDFAGGHSFASFKILQKKTQ